MNPQEQRIVNKMLDAIELCKKDDELEFAIRLHGEFVKSVAIRMDAETRKAGLKR